MTTDPPVPLRRLVAAGCLAGGPAFALFALTASPYVGSGDTAQFQTLARTGGIAHAGYPLLVMLLEAFGRLPIGSLPYRANLLSVISGAVVVGLAAGFAIALTRRLWPGLVAALALALALTFWKEATHAGVHAFSLALGVAAFLLSIRCASRPGGAVAFALGLLGGLGLVSHLSVLALLPVVAASIVIGATSGRLRLRHLGLGLAGMAIGLSPLLYIIVHDRPDQPMNYIHDTLRPDNAAELSGGHPPVGRLARAAWLLSARQYLGGFVFQPFADWPVRLRNLGLDVLINEFPLWGFLLVPWGAWTMWRRRDPAGLFLGLWLAGSLFWVLYGATPAMTPIFFLPGLWVSALFIAVALADLAGRSRPLLAAASVLLLLTPFARLAVAEPPGPFARAGTLRGLWLAAPARWDPFLHDPLWDAYGRNAMGALAPRAVVLSCWEAATTLRYFRHAEPLRDDVDVLYHCLLPRPALAAADSAGRPVYTTYPLTREMTGGRAFHEVARWTRGGLWRIAAPGSGSPPR